MYLTLLQLRRIAYLDSIIVSSAIWWHSLTNYIEMALMLAIRSRVGEEEMLNLMTAVCKCSNDHPGMEVAWLLGNLSLSSVSTSDTRKSSAQGAGFLSCPAFTPDSVCTHSRPGACREDVALLLFDQSWYWVSEKLCDLGKSTLRETRQLCLIYSFTSNIRPSTRMLKLTA